MNVIAKSRMRVPSHTSTEMNEHIRSQTERNIKYYSEHPDQIDQRLGEIEAEWDIERVLETMSSVLTLGGLTLGMAYDKRFLALPLFVQLFFLQHAIQGWCPPLPLLRRLGVRTAEEIEIERWALRGIKEDPQHRSPVGTVDLISMLESYKEEDWH